MPSQAPISAMVIRHCPSPYPIIIAICNTHQQQAIDADFAILGMIGKARLVNQVNLYSIVAVDDEMVARISGDRAILRMSDSILLPARTAQSFFPAIVSIILDPKLTSTNFGNNSSQAFNTGTDPLN